MGVRIEVGVGGGGGIVIRLREVEVRDRWAEAFRVKPERSKFPSFSSWGCKS